ncbi:MAG: DUF3885 domain-containing protein [Bacteroidota bacterium]|nr:DUF3885 domain-containing protein [Bacteroidota bacterium]
MSAQFNFTEFIQYIKSTFPEANLAHNPIRFSNVYLRFELGANYGNGTKKRIEQATKRAVQIFEKIFTKDDQLILVIKRWINPDADIISTDTKEYLFSLIMNIDPSSTYSEIIPADEYSEDPCEQTLAEVNAKDLDYYNIIKGIIHHEQGKYPRIYETIYFINKASNIIYYLYDDRGCLIYSDGPDRLKELYNELKGWIVDHAPEKEYFDSLFGSK